MAPQAASRTVLLVDDEPSIRALLRRFLLNLEYQVLEAATGSKALETIQGQMWLDLLVTDVIMPEMNGFSLAARVASLHPETRVLLITGQADHRPEVEDALRWTPYAFLLKPFTSTALTQKLEYLLLTRKGPHPSQPSTAARFTKAIPVVYRIADQAEWLRGQTVDISDSGLLLAAASEFAVGTRLDLTLESSEAVGSLGSGTIRRHGRVVRLGTPTSSTPYPVGIQFISA